MNNSYENLPEEYENDGNTYCHGIVNCKYFYDGECDFYSMGSGNPDDMPCISQANSTIKAFQEWREKQETEQEKTLEERPQGDLISRSALKKAICEKGIKGYEEYNQGLATALDLIDLAPTISPFKAIHDELHKGEEE